MKERKMATEVRIKTALTEERSEERQGRVGRRVFQDKGNQVSPKSFGRASEDRVVGTMPLTVPHGGQREALPSVPPTSRLTNLPSPTTQPLPQTSPFPIPPSSPQPCHIPSSPLSTLELTFSSFLPIHAAPPPYFASAGSVPR